MKPSLISRSLVSIAAALTLWTAGATSAAQPAYPNRPIQLVHGFGAGGNADVVSRLMAQKLGDALGQSVIVDIKSGAGGSIASAYAAKSNPDGYTLVMLAGAHTVSGALRTLPYDSIEDFSFISTVSSFPFVLAVKADNSVKTLAELIERSKRNPVTFSSVGVGSTQHMVGELLAAESGGQFLHIPFRGGGAPVQAVLASDVVMLSDTLTVANPQLQAGTLRALGVTSAESWPLAPTIPTVAQTVPGFEVRSWLGIAAAKDTPREIVDLLNRHIQEILRQPDTQAALAKIGSVATPSTPEAMRARIVQEIQRWRSVAQQRGITVQ